MKNTTKIIIAITITIIGFIIFFLTRRKINQNKLPFSTQLESTPTQINEETITQIIQQIEEKEVEQQQIKQQEQEQQELQKIQQGQQVKETTQRVSRFTATNYILNIEKNPIRRKSLEDKFKRMTDDEIFNIYFLNGGL